MIFFNALYFRNRNLINISLITIIVIVVYHRIVTLGFIIGWDDQWAIINSYTEDGFTWENLCRILTEFYGGQYAPLNQLYYTLIYCLFDYSPLAFHIAGLLIHIINSCIVYNILLELGKKIFPNQALKITQIALISSILFAISPFNIEPVVWNSASKVLIYALFYLGAILCYLRYLAINKSRYYYGSMALFIFSFASKEQAVTFPICMILCDHLFNRNFKNKDVILEKLPFLILSILFGFLTIQSQGTELFEVSEFYSFSDRILISFFTLTEYITKTFLPINLSFIYSFPFQIGDRIPIFLWIYPVAIFFVALTYLKTLAREMWLNFGLLFFIIHISLVLNIISLARFSIIADRYAYVASLGLYFILACLVIKIYPFYKKTTIICSIIYLLYFASYTNQHINVWKTAGSLKNSLKIIIQNREDFQLWKNKNIK